jgi:hypothetical protein
MNKFAILILSVVVITASCSKNSTPIAGRSDMLRTGKWSIESGTVTFKLPSRRDTTVNYLTFLPSCRHDDYLVFHDNQDASIFSNTVKCNPGDPDSVTFRWGFANNNNNLSLYHGFNFVYGITDTLLPFKFDTLHFPPNLELDTLYGVNDTLAGFTRSLIVLDTIWTNRYDSLPLPFADVYNSQVVSFSQAAFTINFTMYGYSPDSTNHHTGLNPIVDGSGGPAGFIDSPVIYRLDTFKYSITYKNF